MNDFWDINDFCYNVEEDYMNYNYDETDDDYNNSFEMEYNEHHTLMVAANKQLLLTACKNNNLKDITKLFPDCLLYLNKDNVKEMLSPLISNKNIEAIALFQKDNLPIDYEYWIRQCIMLRDEDLLLHFGKTAPHIFENNKKGNNSLLHYSLSRLEFDLANHFIEEGFNIDKIDFITLFSYVFPKSSLQPSQHFTTTHIDDDISSLSQAFTLEENELLLFQFVYEKTQDKPHFFNSLLLCPNDHIASFVKAFMLFQLNKELNQSLPEQATIFQPKL